MSDENMDEFMTRLSASIIKKATTIFTITMTYEKAEKLETILADYIETNGSERAGNGSIYPRHFPDDDIDVDTYEFAVAFLTAMQREMVK